MTRADLESQAPTVDLALRLGYTITRHAAAAYTVALCGVPVVPGLVVDTYEDALGIIIGGIATAGDA